MSSELLLKRCFQISMERILLEFFIEQVDWWLGTAWMIFDMEIIEFFMMEFL